MNNHLHHLSAHAKTAVAAGMLLALVGCWGHSDQGPYPGAVGGNQAMGVAVADLTGSGKLDLISSTAFSGSQGNLAGLVSVDLQSATQPGTFSLPVRSAAGVNPAGFVVAKLTGSGLPGLVVVNPQLDFSPLANNTVSVMLPDPATPGGFLAPTSLALGTRNPSAVAVGDLNGDGAPDIAVAADGGSDVLVFFQGTPAGTYGAAASVPAGGQPTAVAIADVNQDGLPDLVVTTVGNSVSVILQNPAQPGTFLAPVSYTAGTGPVAVVVADLNGDGKPDLVVANTGTATAATTQGITILLQDPAHAGAFLPGVSYPVGDSYSTCVAVADLNGDGLPDLAVANLGLPGWPGSVSVLLQVPGAPGTFAAPAVYSGLTGPTWVAIGDLDGDGLPDLAVADGDTYVRLQVQGSPGVFGPPLPFLR